MSTFLAYTAGSNNGQSIIQQSDSPNADGWYKCLPLAAYFSYLFCGASSLHLGLSAAQDKCNCFKEIQKSFFPYTRMITLVIQWPRQAVFLDPQHANVQPPKCDYTEIKYSDFKFIS